jgi:hypothetical protein
MKKRPVPFIYNDRREIPPWKMRRFVFNFRTPTRVSETIYYLDPWDAKVSITGIRIKRPAARKFVELIVAGRASIRDVGSSSFWTWSGISKVRMTVQNESNRKVRCSITLFTDEGRDKRKANR